MTAASHRPNTSAVVNMLLEEAKSDYVGLWTILWEVRERLGISDLDQRRQLTMEIVEALLDAGLRPVTLLQDGGCLAWPETDARAVISRIAAEWTALRHEPDVGDIAWFDLSS